METLTNPMQKADKSWPRDAKKIVNAICTAESLKSKSGKKTRKAKPLNYVSKPALKECISNGSPNDIDSMYTSLYDDIPFRGFVNGIDKYKITKLLEDQPVMYSVSSASLKEVTTTNTYCLEDATVAGIAVKGHCLVTCADNAMIFGTPDAVNAVTDLIRRKCLIETPKTFGLLVQGSSIYVRECPLDDGLKVDIGLNYGSAFVDHHSKIVDKLNNNKNGLFIFNGIPGTGKTTYIKQLAEEIPDRRFILVPVAMIESLSSPAIVPVLMDHKDSILILEDADKALMKREAGSSSDGMVATILNLGDGILGALLKISIIVTYNTETDNIDEALLRKGRLHYEYKFDKLSVDDSNRLLTKIGADFKAVEPMTLAEIYNYASDNNHRKLVKGKLGF